MGVIDNELNWRGVRPIPDIRGVWPAPNAPRAQASSYQAGLGALVIYTVPADKILFVTLAMISGFMTTDNNVIVSLAVRDDEDDVQYYPAFLSTVVKGTLLEKNSFFPALEIPATWDLTISCGHADAQVLGAFFGWQEDA